MANNDDDNGAFVDLASRGLLVGGGVAIAFGLLDRVFEDTQEEVNEIMSSTVSSMKQEEESPPSDQVAQQHIAEAKGNVQRLNQVSGGNCGVDIQQFESQTSDVPQEAALQWKSKVIQQAACVDPDACDDAPDGACALVAILGGGLVAGKALQYGSDIHNNLTSTPDQNTGEAYVRSIERTDEFQQKENAAAQEPSPGEDPIFTGVGLAVEGSLRAAGVALGLTTGQVALVGTALGIPVDEQIQVSSDAANTLLDLVPEIEGQGEQITPELILAGVIAVAFVIFLILSLPIDAVVAVIGGVIVAIGIVVVTASEFVNRINNQNPDVRVQGTQVV